MSMDGSWRQVSIGDIGRVITGSTPATASPEFYGGDIPFISPGDLGKGLVVDKAARALTEAGFAKARPVPAGSILYTCIGSTIGKSAIAGRTLATNQQINSVICDPEKVDNAFIYYALNFRADSIKRLAGTQAVPIVNKSVFENVTFPVPPLFEQRKIGEILWTWDEAIEKLEGLKAANLRRRTYLRTHVFTGAVRLPGFSGVWKNTRLAEVLREHGLKSTGKEEVFSVSVHKGLVNQIKHLGRSFAAAQTGHYNRVLPGDIVYTKSPTGNFPLGIIKQSTVGDEVIVSPLYGVFTPSTQALGMILNAYFESPITVRNFLYPLVQKGAKNTISITNRRFLEGFLKLPMDPAEQTAIAEVIASSEAEFARIEAEIKALIRQKRGLTQKLLTGKWRVTP